VSATYLGRRQLGFAYLDPRNRIQHQSDLQAQSTLHADFAQEAFWVVPMLLAQRLQSAGDYQAALDWYWLVYPYNLTHVVSIYHKTGQETVFPPDLTFPPGWSTALDPFTLVTKRPVPFTRYTLMSIIRCHVDFADAEFTRETDESVAHART